MYARAHACAVCSSRSSLHSASAPRATRHRGRLARLLKAQRQSPALPTLRRTLPPAAERAWSRERLRTSKGTAVCSHCTTSRCLRRQRRNLSVINIKKTCLKTCTKSCACYETCRPTGICVVAALVAENGLCNSPFTPACHFKPFSPRFDFPDSRNSLRFRARALALKMEGFDARRNNQQLALRRLSRSALQHANESLKVVVLSDMRV